MVRATFVAVLLCSSSYAVGPAIDPATAKADDKGTLWYDVRPLGIEGQAWTDLKAPFDRLPAKAEKTVRPPVWGLSRHSAGLAVRFVTDSTSIPRRSGP